jgi:phosphohistidine phosphatase SixA
MRRTTAVAVLLTLLAAPAGAQEAIYLVRHAERADQSSDSPLSSAGEARAASLARLLRDAGITHIFTTDLRRTIQTAAPLAAAIHVTPRQLPAADVAASLTALRSLAPTDRALVVGHSNTVPAILSGLGIPNIAIADSEHDNLFIVSPRAAAAPMFLRLRY